MSPIVTVIIAVLCLSAGCAGGFAIFRYILTGKYKDTIKEAEKAAEIAARPAPDPTPLDRVEAQIAYTAMMTDTMLEG